MGKTRFFHLGRVILTPLLCRSRFDGCGKKTLFLKNPRNASFQNVTLGPVASFRKK
jgi:hypothetical protein